MDVYPVFLVSGRVTNGFGWPIPVSFILPLTQSRITGLLPRDNAPNRSARGLALLLVRAFRDVVQVREHRVELVVQTL